MPYRPTLNLNPCDSRFFFQNFSLSWMSSLAAATKGKAVSQQQHTQTIVDGSHIFYREELCYRLLRVLILGKFHIRNINSGLLALIILLPFIDLVALYKMWSTLAAFLQIRYCLVNHNAHSRDFFLQCASFPYLKPPEISAVQTYQLYASCYFVYWISLTMT